MNFLSSVSNQPQISPEVLKQTPLFSDLDREALEHISSLMQYRAFGSNITLFHQAMPGTTLYLLVDGYVRIYSTGQSGQEFTYYIYGPSDIFGELSLLDNGYHSATCTTVTPIKIWLLSRNNLFKIMQQNPVIMHQMMKLIAFRVRAATQKSEAMAFQDVQGRLVYEILNLEARYGRPTEEGSMIDMPLTQKDLASMVGASRESVNKSLGLFRSQNLIHFSETNIIILDRDRLERILLKRGR
jgi:CRP-like cAMP-binding protein